MAITILLTIPTSETNTHVTTRMVRIGLSLSANWLANSLCLTGQPIDIIYSLEQLGKITYNTVRWFASHRVGWLAPCLAAYIVCFLVVEPSVVPFQCNEFPQPGVCT